MIYEARSYRLSPRGVPEFINIFGKAYQKRQSLSRISAFFYTEIGPLNEVIHIWPYKDAEEREKKRARSRDKKYNWPPKVAHLLKDQRSEIFIPSPMTPTFAKGNRGPIFEWREYMLIPGMIGEMYKNWEIAQSAAGTTVLMTESTTIFIDYQKAVAESLMPHHFVQLLGYQMAWHLAEVITDQTTKSIKAAFCLQLQEK